MIRCLDRRDGPAILGVWEEKCHLSGVGVDLFKSPVR